MYGIPFKIAYALTALHDEELPKNEFYVMKRLANDGNMFSGLDYTELDIEPLECSCAKKLKEFKINGRASKLVFCPDKNCESNRHTFSSRAHLSSGEVIEMNSPFSPLMLSKMYRTDLKVNGRNTSEFAVLQGTNTNSFCLALYTGEQESIPTFLGMDKSDADFLEGFGPCPKYDFHECDAGKPFDIRYTIFEIVRCLSKQPGTRIKRICIDEKTPDSVYIAKLETTNDTYKMMPSHSMLLAELLDVPEYFDDELAKK